MTTSRLLSLTPEQMATYARNYVMLRDAFLSGNPAVIKAFDEAAAVAEGQGTSAGFDKLLESVAAILGY